MVAATETYKQQQKRT